MRPVTGKIIRMLTARLIEDHKSKHKMPAVGSELQNRVSLSSNRPSLAVPDMAVIDKEVQTHLSKLLEHLDRHLGPKKYFGDA
jgi:hypothetical protein